LGWEADRAQRDDRRTGRATRGAAVEIFKERPGYARVCVVGADRHDRNTDATDDETTTGKTQQRGRHALLTPTPAGANGDPAGGEPERAEQPRLANEGDRLTAPPRAVRAPRVEDCVAEAPERQRREAGGTCPEQHFAEPVLRQGGHRAGLIGLAASAAPGQLEGDHTDNKVDDP